MIKLDIILFEAWHHSLPESYHSTPFNIPPPCIILAPPKLSNVQKQPRSEADAFQNKLNVTFSLLRSFKNLWVRNYCPHVILCHLFSCMLKMSLCFLSISIKIPFFWSKGNLKCILYLIKHFQIIIFL